MAKRGVLCTNKEHTYKRFAAEKDLQLVQIEDGKEKLGVYHIQHVNSYNSRLKLFMARFRGVVTKDLTGYLVWHNVIKEDYREKYTLLKLAVRAVELTANSVANPKQTASRTAASNSIKVLFEPFKSSKAIAVTPIAMASFVNFLQVDVYDGNDMSS